MLLCGLFVHASTYIANKVDSNSAYLRPKKARWLKIPEVDFHKQTHGWIYTCVREHVVLLVGEHKLLSTCFTVMICIHTIEGKVLKTNRGSGESSERTYRCGPIVHGSLCHTLQHATSYHFHLCNRVGLLYIHYYKQELPVAKRFSWW